MSLTQPTIKPNNHRVHPCPNDKKLSLVNKLISDNRDDKIIVVASTDAKAIEEFLQTENSQALENVQVLDDKTLIKDSKDLTCDLLISFDVPTKAVIYMARLSHTTSKALLLLNETEQKLLYPIETLLGRVIKQDIIEGFEYEAKEKPKTDARPAPKKMTQNQIKEEAKKRYDKETGEPKPKKDFKKSDKDKVNGEAREGALGYDKWAKKKKAPNKYLGKDENGKAIFSGKSGDRNHRYDGTPRDKYDAPKKTGRKINIKSLKKPSNKKD
jgi:hypothetical protein